MANKRSLGFSSTDFRKKFRAGMTVRTYRDNEVIFSQGDTADAVFYIQSGTVKLTVAAIRRKKAIVAVLLRKEEHGFDAPDRDNGEHEHFEQLRRAEGCVEVVCQAQDIAHLRHRPAQRPHLVG